MVRSIFLLCMSGIPFFLFSAGNSVPETKEDRENGWIQLFNGKDIVDWTAKINGYEAGNNFANTFRVNNGILQVRYDDYDGLFNNRFGHLYFNQPFSHYHLVVEYKFVDYWHEGAPHYTKLNSGVMFHSQDPYSMNVDQDWPISVEMQFLASAMDENIRPTGNMCSPGTDVYYQEKLEPNHCVLSTSDGYPTNEWVKAELIVRGDESITHLINGKEVLTYTKPAIGGGVVHKFKPEIKIDGKRLTSGFIALQSEGQAIDFRRVDIKPLPID